MHARRRAAEARSRRRRLGRASRTDGTDGGVRRTPRRRRPKSPASRIGKAGADGSGATRRRKGAGARRQDRLELDTTQITGNRELPKVLYIVPWKRSDLGDLVGKPVNSLLDEVLHTSRS